MQRYEVSRRLAAADGKHCTQSTSVYIQEVQERHLMIKIYVGVAEDFEKIVM
jgi:hypothetical protein